MGVVVGTRVSVIVGVTVTVFVKVGVRLTGRVLIGCSRVGEFTGDGGAGCVKAARVKTTIVATSSGFAPPGVAAFCRLQAQRKEIKRKEVNRVMDFFMGKLSPDWIKPLCLLSEDGTEHQ
jgi:hypothetical protein